jgi:hypothetical protein
MKGAHVYTQPPASFAAFVERLAGFFLSPFGVGIGLCLVLATALLVALLVAEWRRPKRARRR